MAILDVATMVASLVLTIWPLIVLRRWTKQRRGEVTLRGWVPAVVIPAQGAIVLLWFLMLLNLPWTGYVLYSFVGGLWVFPARLVIAFLFVLVPGGVMILDAAWLRLHPMPSHWTLTRIWSAHGVAWAAILVMIFLGEFFGAQHLAAGVTILITVIMLFTTVSWVFLTLWWVASHPLVGE